MLQNLAAEIISCYERARQASEKAERARSDQFKADFLAAESRWLALAYSYEHQNRLSRTIHEFGRQRKAGAITRMLREQGVVFDALTVPYSAANQTETSPEAPWSGDVPEGSLEPTWRTKR
jgi:hypothetical protein